jgi:uncharacterized protein
MNAPDPMMQPLTLQEFTILEEFLVSERTPEEALSSLEMLDGYMTAAIVGPQAFEPKDWYALMWDKNKQLEPQFSSADEADMISELIVRHNNSLEAVFLEDPESFVPLFDRVAYESEEIHKLAVEEWCMGFLIGMELAYDAWQPLFENEEAAVMTMGFFMLSKVSDEFAHMTEREIEEITSTVGDAVIGIYLYWHGDDEMDEEDDDELFRE